jgi:hypothetical protein
MSIPVFQLIYSYVHVNFTAFGYSSELEGEEIAG